MLRISIVEDVEASAQTLVCFCARYAAETSMEIMTACFDNPIVFLQKYRGEFDVVLMDILMPQMNGMECARRLRKCDSNVILCFVTNMARYAIQGYEVGAIDFIIKPVSYDEFSMKMNRIIRVLKKQASATILISSRNEIKKIDIRDLYYMSEKRRDKRNRILHDGEYQRADGRYRYRYIDEDGREKNVYSWRLDKNDPMPSGKKRELSLREKERQIQADQFDHIVTNGGNYTVLELVEKYVSLKTGVRHNTRAGYQAVINLLKKDPFGSIRIDKVRLSDAKMWLVKLQQKDGRGYSSIHSIRGVLRPAFQMAVDDDLIRKNPFGFELASVIVNDSVTREAITRKQEREFLKFVKEDKHYCRYYDAFFILFHTGLRISEFCGLTISDIEFSEKRIKVDHQLQRTGQMVYAIQEPKTEKGIRYVPMTDEVAACFHRIIQSRKKPRVEPVVDGYTGFLFLDKNDMPMVALHWEKYMQHVVAKYNKIYRVQLPKITPHVCRHTFCSNMAKSGMSPKTLQYIMGHSDISVTLNTYTHVQFDDAKEELLRVSNG